MIHNALLLNVITPYGYFSDKIPVILNDYVSKVSCLGVGNVLCSLSGAFPAVIGNNVIVSLVERFFITYCILWCVIICTSAASRAVLGVGTR